MTTTRTRVPKFTEDVFWSRVAMADNECWAYTGPISKQTGYGKAGRTKSSHVYSWELQFGQVPVGKCLDHLCRVRRCCNPAHLEVTTPGENVLRGEGLAAQNVRKTECPHGHPFDAENTELYIDPRGGQHRKCRACRRAKWRAWWEKKQLPTSDED